MKRTPALVVTPLLVVLAVLASLVVSSPASATASTEKAQRRLNSLGCNAGPVDGTFGDWTRSAVIRFQSRHTSPRPAGSRDHPRQAVRRLRQALRHPSGPRRARAPASGS